MAQIPFNLINVNPISAFDRLDMPCPSETAASGDNDTPFAPILQLDPSYFSTTGPFVDQHALQTGARGHTTPSNGWQQCQTGPLTAPLPPFAIAAQSVPLATRSAPSHSIDLPSMTTNNSGMNGHRGPQDRDKGQDFNMPPGGFQPYPPYPQADHYSRPTSSSSVQGPPPTFYGPPQQQQMPYGWYNGRGREPSPNSMYRQFRPPTAFEAWQQSARDAQIQGIRQPSTSPLASTTAQMHLPMPKATPLPSHPPIPKEVKAEPSSRPTSSAGPSGPSMPALQPLQPSQPPDIDEDDMSKTDEGDEEDKSKPEAKEKVDHRKRKRNRTIRSCVPCHNHKRKCDRKRPCGRCTALGLTGTCVYEVDETRDLHDPNVAETDRMRGRIAELEQVVRELRQKNPGRGQPASSDSDGEKGDKKRRVIVDRYARFKIDEATMAAVAAQADGEEKTYKNEPYSASLLPGEEIVYDQTGRKTFLGAPAGKSMLRRLRELMSTRRNSDEKHDDELLTVPEELAFTGWFPDMRKTFPFTTIWSHENFSGEIIGLLPNKEQSELLLDSWRTEVCPFFIAWHTSSLEVEYRRFFTMTTAEKMNVPLSSLAIFLMICSLGCVMRASKMEIFGHPDRKVANEAKLAGVSPPRDVKDLTCSRLQSELYLSAAYQALRLCSFMSNPTLATIQAQVLINVYLLNSERAADAWSQTGALVRQCIAMGLHVDPASLDSKVSMRDAETRRRVWWSVAGLDALFCVSFGRPSVINYYTTNLPQDRTDDNLSDAPGSAQSLLPPSNVLRNETTDMTYHAAYFQLTIPSYELLDRIFRVDWKYSRSAIYGWFSRTPDQGPAEEQVGHTYEDAIRLAQDIFQWYAHLPRGMRFDIEEDTAEALRKDRSELRINQTLALCVKTFMIVPYLRADPSAYPESAEICFKAANMLLTAYTIGSEVKASIFWSWWTMSFRAFHAAAVCAFLAIREPHSQLALRCLSAVKGTIQIFEDRIASWNTAHPVQADLCHGLLKLEKLARLATQQKVPSPENPTAAATLFDPQTLRESPDRLMTPLSAIKGFPNTSPSNVPPESANTHNTARNFDHAAEGWTGSLAMNMGANMGIGDGFNGPESVAFPNLWASMFGIKVDDNSWDRGTTGMGSAYAPGTPLGFGLPMQMMGGATMGDVSLGSASAGAGPSLGNVQGMGDR